MIIDCHSHLGRNHHIDATPRNLLESMDNAKIDKSLVFAGMLNDAPNEWMLEQIYPYRDRLLGVASAHPAGQRLDYRVEEAKKIVDWYQEGKIVACKFYTGYDHYYPNDDLIKHYLNVFSEAGCPVIFHMGDCLNSAHHAKLKYAHPLHVDDVAVDYPGINFIIAHMGFPWHRDAAEVCYKNPNVFADISGFVYKDFTGETKGKFKKVLDEFLDISSSDKLLFGTDFPISNQASYIEALEYCSTHTVNRKLSEAYSAQSMTQNVKKVFKL